LVTKARYRDISTAWCGEAHRSRNGAHPSQHLRTNARRAGLTIVQYRTFGRVAGMQAVEHTVHLELEAGWYRRFRAAKLLCSNANLESAIEAFILRSIGRVAPVVNSIMLFQL
jgi:hypothetical protein